MPTIDRDHKQQTKMLLNNSRGSRPFVVAHGHCAPQTQGSQIREGGGSLTAKPHPPRVYLYPQGCGEEGREKGLVMQTPDPSKAPRVQPHLPCGTCD